MAANQDERNWEEIERIVGDLDTNADELAALRKRLAELEERADDLRRAARNRISMSRYVSKWSESR